MSSPRRFALLNRSVCERTHAREVVGRLSQEEQLLNPFAATIHRLTNPADRFAPPEDLFDAFAFALADGIASPACRSTVNRRATHAAVVLRHVRRHTVGTATRHEACRVVIFVGANRNGGAIVESGVRGVGKRQEKAVAIEGECCFSR